MGNAIVSECPVGGRAATIAKWFGLKERQAIRGARGCEPNAIAIEENSIHSASLPRPAAGKIILITGASGSGKSSLLRHYRRWLGQRGCFDLAAIRLKRRPIVELFPKLSLIATLELLSRVGLAEAHSYLRPPEQLSDGQRWRLRLAMAMERAGRTGPSTVARPAAISPGCHGRLVRPGPPSANTGSELPVAPDVPWPVRNEAVRLPLCLLCDEFASLLDPVTACVVAHALRRSVSHANDLAAILATSRDDLVRALRPDAIVTCNFGQMHVQNITDSKGETHAARATIVA